MTTRSADSRSLSADTRPMAVSSDLQRQNGVRLELRGFRNALSRLRILERRQTSWAAANVDTSAVARFIAETFRYVEEAKIALEVIRAAGLPAVITLAVHKRRP